VVEMTGEMGRADLKNYPEMVALTKTMRKNGLDAKMLPFDVYQGPYIFVSGLGVKIWYFNRKYLHDNPWIMEMSNGRFYSTQPSGVADDLTSKQVMSRLRHMKKVNPVPKPSKKSYGWR
jgi:hypothetical protein